MTDAVVEKKNGAEDVVWDLSPLYASVDDPKIAQDMARLRQDVEAWAGQYRGQVASLSAAEIIEALGRYEALLDRLVRLGYYASLMFATDTTNPTYGALQQKLNEFNAEMQQKLLFFDLEWNTLDDAAVGPILSDPALGKYRHYLEASRRYKPHKLSEIEEQLLVETDVTGSEAWVRLFTQIMGASRFEFDGEQLTQSKIMAKLHDPDREIRRRAAESITATLQAKAMELTYIFNVLVADKAADDRRRGYATWISARNLANKASDAVVEALIDAVTSNYDIVARHYALKRKIMGVDQLEDYDRYAPLPLKTAEREYSWAEAREIVQTAYDAFSPTMGAIVRRFFDEHWIDAALQPAKRSGAFAAPVTPSVHPYVFMNFTGQGRDVKTLAHELGHGVHMFLAGQKQGLIGATTPLTTAEMASVFGEQMVFDDLMSKEPDPAARLSMLTRMIEDIFATVFRQVSMNRFEDRLHQGRRSQGELTTEDISAMWAETQQAMFQDSVHLTDGYGLWWSYIPHFIHTPGYVYAYAFGQLLVLALYQLYRERGADFVPDYIEVLAAGDSDYPEKILARVGVDLTDPNFWTQGLDIIRGMVEQEEQLAREVFPDKVQ